jgi:hypothetical protein
MLEREIDAAEMIVGIVEAEENPVSDQDLAQVPQAQNHRHGVHEQAAGEKREPPHVSSPGCRRKVSQARAKALPRWLTWRFTAGSIWAKVRCRSGK